MWGSHCDATLRAAAGRQGGDGCLALPWQPPALALSTKESQQPADLPLDARTSDHTVPRISSSLPHSSLNLTLDSILRVLPSEIFVAGDCSFSTQDDICA